MEVKSCDGSCCELFVWRTPPEKMREVWEVSPDADGDVGTYGNRLDQLMIADMLVPVSHEEAYEINPEYAELSKNAGLNNYTCKHWDRETKLCTVWDHRPRMCAEYPYGSACFFCNDQ